MFNSGEGFHVNSSWTDQLGNYSASDMRLRTDGFQREASTCLAQSRSCALDARCCSLLFQFSSLVVSSFLCD